MAPATTKSPQLLADWQKKAKPAGMSFQDKVAYVGLLTASPMPITRFGPRSVGTAFAGVQWRQLFQNTLARPVAIQVEATFVTPGARIRLARDSSGGDAFQVDEIANAGAALSFVLSRSIIVDGGGATIYVQNNTPGGLALLVDDVFRVLVWDPMKHVERTF